ncbi:glypican-3 isoform X3 [Synchiropus splendidus]|uniref:glypican-3 isoform X3 n=1 Tax=Synchiropus splendidus TaxID=270530 RepID=UPI00237EA778|nr:glypican-3 isoform X3 [Synchiropus splendidus]
MESRHVQGALVLCVFTQLWLQLGGQVPDCQQVRAAFQSLHPGSKWLPETPLPGTDLQVCQTKGPTCCSKKMEERYQVAARGNMEAALQAVSAQLKRLIIQNAAIFQEAFDLVLRHGRNSTLAMLKSEFPALGGAAQSLVGQLFLDMSLYILGSDSTVDQMVTLLYSRLFPLTYRRLLAGSGAPLSEECVKEVWKEAAAFGPYPKLMMTRLARSLLATRVFLQALNLGIEVVNTTDHLRPSRDCGRALLRLWYCPHCQGLLGPPLCPGLCQALMQGCLGGAAEVQPHWSTYVQGLAKLAGGMRGEQDMEAVVLRLPSILRLAIKQAVTSRSRLSALGLHIQPEALQLLLQRPGGGAVQPGSRSRKPLPLLERFVGPSPKRPSSGSDSRSHRAPEPVISQIIDKLKHINQLLRMVTVSEKRWRARSRGAEGWSDDGEEGFQSGDCDDEDECSGVSGLGPPPPPPRKRLRIFADLADNLAMDDFTFQEQLLTPQLATAGAGGVPSPAEPLWKSYLGLSVSVTLTFVQHCHQ